ncbi:MAG: hypothetical protein ACHQAX_05980 [Gammaproteobacteria bacterium]
MKTNFVGLAVIEPHIRAYWLRRHGVGKPLNNDPKNAFLDRFSRQIADIIKLVEEAQAEGTHGTKMADIRENLYASLRNFNAQLHEMEIQHFGDKLFCDLIHLLEQDVEGASLHLQPILGTTEGESNLPVKSYVKLLGGAILADIPQGFNPFFGSEKNEENELVSNEGVCAAIVDSWGNREPLSAVELFKKQDIYSEATARASDIVHFHEINRLFKNHDALSSNSFYSLLILFSSKNGPAHAIGIRQVLINEIEICEPNYGNFKFKNKADAIKFLQFIAISYFVHSGNDMDKAFLKKAPIRNKQAHSISESNITIQTEPAKPINLDELLRYTLDSISVLVANANTTHSEAEKTINLLLPILKKDRRTTGASHMIQILMESQFFHVIQIVCIASVFRLKETENNFTIMLLDTIVTNIEKLESRLLLRILMKFSPGLDKRYYDQFESMSSNTNRRLILENMMVHKTDVKLLFSFFDKFRDSPALLETIAVNGLSEKLISALMKHDLNVLTRISNMLYGSESLPGEMDRVARILIIEKCMNKMPDNVQFTHAEFVKTMENVIIKATTPMSDEEIFNKTVLASNINSADMLLAAYQFEPENFATLITLCDNIIQNPTCSTDQRNEWDFIKRYAEAIQHNLPDDITAFMNNEQTMENYLKYFERFNKLTFLHPTRIAALGLYTHLTAHLPDKQHCQLLLLLHKKITNLPADITALCNGLTLENQLYLVPILTSKELIHKMSDEQFSTMIEKIASLHPEHGLATINEVLLNPVFVDNLSIKQIALLVKSLTTTRDNGHCLAEAFQYDEQASFAEKCREHAVFPRAITGMMADVSPNKTRWAQIVDVLRKRADHLLSEDATGTLATSLGKDITYVNDLANKSLLTKFAQPKAQTSNAKRIT